MSWYWGSWGAVIISMIVSYLFSCVNIRGLKRVEEILHINVSFLCTLLPVLLYAGLRYGIGIDYWAYKTRYDSWEIGTEQSGYSFLFAKLHDICRALDLNYDFFTFLVSFIFLSLTLSTIFSLSPSITWSLFLFMGCNLYFETMTIFKQSLGLGLILCSLRFLIQDNEKLFFLILALAIGFHTSSAIFIIVFLLKKFPIKHNFQILMLVITILIGNNAEVLFRPIIENTEYAYYYYGMYYDSNRTLYFYKLFNVILYVFLLISIHYLKARKDTIISKLEIFLQMQFVATCLFFTGGAIPEVHRLNYYLLFPCIIGIPMILYELKKYIKFSKLLIIELSIVILMLIYTIYLNYFNDYISIKYDSIVNYIL